MTTQDRPDPNLTLQQLAALPLATMVALQIQSFTAAGVLGFDKDVAACDASGGTFTLDLPSGADVIVGKPYYVKEYHGTNLVTVRGYGGAGTVDGSGSKALAAGEAMLVVARAVNESTLAVTWDVLGQTAPNPAAGGELLAANNLSDLANAATARTNLGVPATATVLAVANNLSDLANAATARTNLAVAASSATLLKADNLSGIASPATARANIGANRKTLTFTRANLIGASANVYRYLNVSGNSETILKIGTVLTGALDADATITASIDAVAVTTGVVTITNPGAAGDKDTATPSGANVIADGAALELTIGGGNTNAVFADISVELSY